MSPDAKSPPGPGGPTRQPDLAGRARVVLDMLSGLEPELRAAAVLAGDREVLASTLDDDAWRQSVVDLAESLEGIGDGDLDSSHIATEEAEVFTVRESGFSLVAVTERFVLASLTSFDIRMSLRDLARETHDA